MPWIPFEVYHWVPGFTKENVPKSLKLVIKSVFELLIFSIVGSPVYRDGNHDTLEQVNKAVQYSTVQYSTVKKYSTVH